MINTYQYAWLGDGNFLLRTIECNRGEQSCRKMYLYIWDSASEMQEKNVDWPNRELADQTGRGLRHLQDIEKGRKNPSYDVLASFIKRLGISANELFYPDASEQEKQVQHFMGKFLACTEDERQIILKTLDCMAEQFISRRYKSSDPQKFMK